MSERDTINEIYECALLWQGDDDGQSNPVPSDWEKAYPLLLAAPDLLAALQGMVAMFDHYDPTSGQAEAFDKATAAIAKAQGEKQ